eukprot:PRCOL_00001668-RA
MVMKKIDEFFKLSERKTSFKTELLAGTATFMTLCYILAVNSRLLSESGGYCTCSEATAEDFDCVFYDDEYALCVEDFRRQLITATALSSFVACVAMGFGANLPFALAPGMGLNAYFTYDVVGYRGTGSVKWQTAMAAIFIEGLLFVVLAVTGLRVKLAKAIPESVRIATTGGIGMFLAHLGLQTAEGIGLVVTDVSTGLTLGGCPPDKRVYATYPPSPVTADSYTCDEMGGQMESATTWIGIVTIALIAIMLKRKVTGAIIIGMTFCTVISWFRGTKVSYFEDDVYPMAGGAGVEGGEYRWEYFKKVAHVETLDDVWFRWDFKDMHGAELGVALITFLYVDLLDTTGTVYAMAEFAGLLDKEGNFPGQMAAFIVDGAATSFGSFMGVSPVTTYIESAPGIEAGGRTGLTAIVVGLYFLVSIFFAPLLASVPPWATGPALVIVGAMMMRGLTKIDWTNYGEAIPAFLTIVIMPLTYSIAYGIIAGIGSYIVINGIDFLIAKILPKKDPAPPVEAPAKADEPAGEGQI